jgi:hypothetical protein
MVDIPATSSFPRDLIKLKGDIKHLYIYYYDIKKDSLNHRIPTILSKSHVIFNKAGSSIVSEEFWPKSRVNDYFCQYDRKGNLVQMTVDDIFSNDYLSSTMYRHKYDTQGRVIESTIYYNNGGDNNGMTIPKTTYKYLPIHEEVIEYIDNKIFYAKTNVDTSHYSIVNRDFSRFGYKMKVAFKESDTVQMKNVKRVNFYNRDMNKVKQSDYNFSDSLLYNTLFEYDKNSYLISSKTYYKGTLSRKTQHSYIYDNKSNWTTDSIFEMDTLSHIILRRFEYVSN